MLAMLEWLCDQLMELEVSNQINADKHQKTPDRRSSRSGYRPRRLDTRSGTLYLMVPKVRKGGYVPFFVTEHKRSEAALVHKVRYGGRVISMAIQVVCGVNEDGERAVIAIEPMMEESMETYSLLFRKLKDRGLGTLKLVISDAHSGLVKAIQHAFPGASWQRCKIHFMRNILAYVPQREKNSFAAKLKLIWMVATAEEAKKIAKSLANEY